MYTMDCMEHIERSVIHIKAPHTIHIGAKVMAAKHRTSMNQYVIDLIEADMTNNEMPQAEVKKGIDLYREATPKQRKVIGKAAKTIDEILVPQDKTSGGTALFPKRVATERLSNGLCKIHATPLDSRGRCMQKGCKYGK